MSDPVRWYVVADGGVSGPDPDKEDVWTVSLDPDHPGWETDNGCPGYGLPKALAEELADAANERYRRQKDKGVS